ncbi:transglutaminase family protein [Prescottella sp. R16]|uniref:transglutaminase-like domain-containing protein n=1 Tax=Prescottella sp. R16 TaxID=3064529 RepID=UPI00272E361D|nr:transglutaminase family protein [Prescottella sp. R16]
MMFDAASPSDFLAGDEFVDIEDRNVRSLARSLRQRSDGEIDFARAAFEWVRDEVGHSYDVGDPRVTLTAGEVLEHRVGLCYAKSHLLAALLRVGGVPTGLCYQRLAHGDGHVLHGLVAVHLDGGWHRQDPRGNKPGIDARFTLGAERLAWPVDPALGEVDYPTLFTSPAACVVDALRGVTDVLSIYDVGLPAGLPVRP